MKPYSLDLRIRVLEAYNRKEGSIRQLAKRFAVHWRSVANWVVRFRREGSIGPRTHRRGPEPILDQEGLKIVAELVEKKPLSTRAELCDALRERAGTQLSVHTMGRALKKLGITRKKRRLLPAKPTDPRSGRPSRSLPRQ